MFLLNYWVNIFNKYNKLCNSRKRIFRVMKTFCNNIKQKENLIKTACHVYTCIYYGTCCQKNVHVQIDIFKFNTIRFFFKIQINLCLFSKREIKNYTYDIYIYISTYKSILNGRYRLHNRKSYIKGKGYILFMRKLI